jgi:hypothetical protein
MKISHERVVPFAKDKVVDIYLNDDFYVGLQKNAGAFTVDILETAPIPGGKTRKARVTTPTRVPPMLRTSDRDEFVDNVRIDSQKMSFEITPSVFADQFSLGGSVEFVDQGASTKLVFTTEVEIRIPLVGRKLEKQAIDEAEKEVDKQIAFLKSWAAR